MKKKSRMLGRWEVKSLDRVTVFEFTDWLNLIIISLSCAPDIFTIVTTTSWRIRAKVLRRENRWRIALI